MMALSLCQKFCPDLIPLSFNERLGDGADGEVFSIQNDLNKVIKFCVLYDYSTVEFPESIESVYQCTSQVLQYLIDNQPDAYARVYSHEYLTRGVRKVIGDEQEFILHYYVMEKLQEISDDERKVFHSILSHEDRGMVKNFSDETLKEMLTGMHRGLDFNLESIIFFYNNFRKTPIHHLDIHVRNIMKDSQGNFKLIDFDRCLLRKDYE